MTVDDLIIKLQAVKKMHGGSVRVCIYDYENNGTHVPDAVWFLDIDSVGMLEGGDDIFSVEYPTILIDDSCRFETRHPVLIQ